MIRAVEGFYREHPNGGRPDIGVLGLIQDILGDISRELRAGFVPSFSNNLKTPALKSVATMFTMDWEQLALYEPQDAELDMIICLVKEGRGLDIIPEFYARLRVSRKLIFELSEAAFYKICLFSCL